MANILVQTTLRDGEGEWQIERFSSIVSLLRNDGHDVVARNRTPQSDGSDPLLSTLDASDFNELWLFAADRGDGLAPADVRGILRFRERGGGVFASRDSENVGLSLLNLGSVGRVNHFRSYNRPRGSGDYSPAPDRVAAGDEYERIVPLEPVHELLRTQKSASGVIEYFPAVQHETAISVPPYAPFARVIAVSGAPHGDAANVAIAIDDEFCDDGRRCGRAVATSCLHHFADGQWNSSRSNAFSENVEEFARNVARWLAPAL
ncbi:MAG TPA: hypothetical protein VIO32_06825 [Candidatus Baltobacteraceae bacterium]